MTIIKKISFANIAVKMAMAMAFLLATTNVSAKELKFATAAPAKTPWVTHMEKSAASLAESSGGDLTLKVFAASQLGDETETIKQVARGRIDMGLFSVSAASIVVPEVVLLTSPFFWDSFEQADCALDNHLTEVFNPIFEAKGLKIVQWQELGWQNLFAKKLITKPSEVVGFKMRVAPAKNHDILWRGLRASGVPLPFAETASGLQTGLIDGGELPTISYVATGMGEIAPYLTNTRHVYQPSILLASTRSWKKLSKKEKKWFNDSLAPSSELRAGVRGAIKFFENKLIESGGTVTNLTDAERAEWSKLYTPKMQAQLIKELGGSSKKIFKAVEAARKACS